MKSLINQIKKSVESITKRPKRKKKECQKLKKGLNNYYIKKARKIRIYDTYFNNSGMQLRD
jgi:hypothetical protein